MSPCEVGVVDAPLAQRADRYREESERQRQQEEAKRISDQAAQTARVQHEHSSVVWTRAYADNYLESERQKREKLAKDEELERELKRIRFEKMYLPQQSLGHMREPWWSPLTEILKIVAPILIATAPLWVPALIRHFQTSAQAKVRKRRRRTRLNRLATNSPNCDRSHWRSA
jgi:hypothetical protein